MDTVDDNPERQVFEEYFNGADGQPRRELLDAALQMQRI